jgi:hypothetical protein
MRSPHSSLPIAQLNRELLACERTHNTVVFTKLSVISLPSSSWPVPHLFRKDPEVPLVYRTSTVDESIGWLDSQ